MPREMTDKNNKRPMRPRPDDRRKRERDARREDFEKEKKRRSLNDWIPKTELGKMVKAGEVTTLRQIYDSNKKVLEPEIIDTIFPELKEKMIDFKKTTRVTSSGRVYSFRASVIVGDENGHIGIGIGTDAERLNAIKKATDKAKKNLMELKKGCGSWECLCGSGHSIPYRVNGQCSSVKVNLIPAPKGVGLVIGDTAKEALQLAGIKDIWSKTRGNTAVKLNFVKAIIDALEKTSTMRMSGDIERKIGAK